MINFFNLFIRNLNLFLFRLRPILTKSSVEIGKWSYVGWGSAIFSFFATDKVIIGKFCSIAGYVKFFTGGEHNHKGKISTFPFKSFFNQRTEQDDIVSKGQIIIGNDVWIGSHSIILSGVHIGDGAVIGAGAIVTKDIPPYSIAVGCPAKVVGYRFAEDKIQKLIKLKWWEWDDKKIRQVYLDFYTDVDEFINKFYDQK